MSREQQELARLASAERHLAWQQLKRTPAQLGEVLSEFPRRHPYLAMGAAAWLAMSFAGKRRRKFGVEGKPSSWLGALAALAVRVLPDMLRAASARKPARKPHIPEPAGQAPVERPVVR